MSNDRCNQVGVKRGIDIARYYFGAMSRSRFVMAMIARRRLRRREPRLRCEEWWWW